MTDPTDARLAKDLQDAARYLHARGMTIWPASLCLAAQRLEAGEEITEAKVEIGACAMLVTLDEIAPKIASAKHLLFKFDLPIARQVLRAALAVMQKA